MSEQSMPSRAFSEALGTALLLSAVVGSGIMAEKLAGGNIAIALLANALATGAVLVVLITMFGAISGAHFNPAVSLVATMDGDLSPSSFTIYVLAQIVGAIAGVWLAHAMFDLPIVQLSQTVRTGTGQWISEVVATFGLVLSILLTVRHRPDFVAVVVGLYITSAYWFTASTSFANPAVTIARTLTNTFAGIAPGDAAPFIAAQIAGAVLGLAAARVFRR